MIKRVMVDAGLIRRSVCSGARDRGASPAFMIGQALCDRLEEMGYQVLFSGDVPELYERQDGAGRPAVCASVAKRWRADCTLRLCVRASEHPLCGSAEAMVPSRSVASCGLAESILQSLEHGCRLCDQGVRRAEGILLLRRCVSHGIVLVLRLPFAQREELSLVEAEHYAAYIAAGFCSYEQDERRVN